MPRAAGLVALAVVMAAAVKLSAAPAATEAARDVDGPDGLTLDVVGACPDVSVVRGLLTQLLSSDEARGTPISIEDQGAQYRIAVGAKATTFDDPARDCAARARQSAVVAANDLRAHPAVLGPPDWTIEKGFVAEGAPGATGAVWAYGAEIRGALGSGRWSLFGAAGVRGPVTLTFDGGWKAELLRVPLDVGARVTVRRSRLRGWLVLGPSLTLDGILGQDLVQTNREWRVDLGALASAGATLRLFGRIGVAAAINVRWQPRPYHLQVVPVGTVGETPTWWFGLSLDYTIDGKASSP